MGGVGRGLLVSDAETELAWLGESKTPREPMAR